MSLLQMQADLTRTAFDAHMLGFVSGTDVCGTMGIAAAFYSVLRDVIYLQTQASESEH